MRGAWRALGVRPVDAACTAVVIALTEFFIVIADGAGQRALSPLAGAFGVITGLPVLLRHRWPLRALLGCAGLLTLMYIVDRRNISPAPLLVLPLYDAAVAGYLVWPVIVPAYFMVTGFFVVWFTAHETLVDVTSEFLPQIAVLVLAVLLGEVVRSRRALAAETADRIRLAVGERDAAAARRVAEERLRIARDLHDTVAHSMATITVQASAALHVLDSRGQDGGVRDALAAIRETSKSALASIRTTLGDLRSDGSTEVTGREGLDGLPALTEAVGAAGAPVTVRVEGEAVPLPAAVDQAAYRILQESLTNVLRHAGAGASAAVRLSYAPGGLTIAVTDDGTGPAGAEPPGHGITGMTERAAALGGELTAGPRPGGGFEVVAHLPGETP